MKTVSINLYSFNELKECAKERAIHEHGIFLDSMPDEYENEQGELIKEYRAHLTDEIIESIEINDYYFFADGSLANVIHYTGTHPKSGQTELKFKGEIYIN